MEDIEKRKKIKKRYIVLISVLTVILTVVIIFVQFTSLGYRMTVPFRSFTEEDSNLYVHKKFTGDIEESVKTVNAARKRITEYFGEIESNPMIIICDDESTIAKLGGDHDTATAVIFKAYSYIVISTEFLNVDVVAHELTHAEVHTKIFKGKFWFQSLVPIWFDEGIALQNDYREKYNEDAWKEVTNNGENVVDLNDINTSSKFYAGETEERRYRYIISKHEVNKWINLNGRNVLLDLLEKINQGEDFNNLYFAK